MNDSQKFDLINLGYDISADSFREEIKQRVERLLKEIEEEKEKFGRLSRVALTEEERKYAYGVATAFQKLENLIKKLFKDFNEGFKW